MSYRSGFVALVGKPNVGKSTLVNRLVGRKVAITSDKPQTTRQRMLGIVHGEGFQAVLVDTPGMMEPRNELHKKMLGVASSEAKDADLVAWLCDLTHGPNDDDRRVQKELRALTSHGAAPWQVLTKADMAKAGAAEAYRKLFPGIAHRFELSAKSGIGVDEFKRELIASLPEGPPFFPPEQVTEHNDRLWLAEVLREKVLDLTHQEIPHAVAVVVEELRPAQGGREGLYAQAIVYVERESQKRIIIGKGGSLLKKVGMLTRQELEETWQQHVFLEIWVKVKKDWRDRKDWLDSLGFG